jgi:hypothetical protein
MAPVSLDWPASDDNEALPANAALPQKEKILTAD